MTGPRSRPAAAARLVGCLAAVLLASTIVLAAAVGPAYGRTRRAGRAAAVGSRLLLRALGIRLLTSGAARDGAALVVANHVSWVDILAVTATAPVVPVAKCEVARWPLIGPLARRTGTVFVSRRIGRDLPVAVARITDALRRGHRVLLFPEGTTTSGGPPRAFRRAGFQAAVDAAAPVQPVSIDYADRRGRPTGSTAFIDDDTLLGSAWRVVRAGPVLVRVRWHTAAAAIENGGHRTGHRARAAHGARGRICRALGAVPPPAEPVRPAPNVTSVSRGALPARRSADAPLTIESPDRAA